MSVIVTLHSVDLFNLPLTRNKIPDGWWTAVVPIHKAESRHGEEIFSYRLVSPLPMMLEFLERCIRDAVSSHLMTPARTSYEARISVDMWQIAYDRFAIFLKDVTAKMDKRDSAEVGSLNFQKTFDSVNYKLLLSKVGSLDVAPSVTGWIGDYLHDCAFSHRWSTVLSGRYLQ